MVDLRTGRHIHHQILTIGPAGIREVARPIRARGWWTRWKLERECRRECRHCWHLEHGHLIDWWCCMCSAEIDGMPPHDCKYCAIEEGPCP